MAVLILGGYGVFGTRLCTLLAKDGHAIIIAGRTLEKAEKLAQHLNANALYLDRNKDLAPIITAGVTTLIDASGPFNTYGDTPYRVVEFCLTNGINYIDLSDTGNFTANITQFDNLAKTNKCFALSGASSVPAVSAAAITQLCTDLDTIETIETAIMPGNKAPRGYSVVASILSQAGLPLRQWRAGHWRDIKCWADKRVYTFENGTRRVAKTIGAPDLLLFPEHFSAKSVSFRAGMELGILNAAVSLIATLNTLRRCPPPKWLIRLAHKFAQPTEHLGSDTGGMIVDVIGMRNKTYIKKRWQLWAEQGDGSFIPTITARAIVNKQNHIPYGARPCIHDISLVDLRAAFADLSVADGQSEAPYLPLFIRSLGETFKELPPTVQELHTVIGHATYSGTAKITRGTNWLSRIIANVFRFPKAGQNIPVTVQLDCQENTETWRRNFAGQTFSSVLTSDQPNQFSERFGPFKFQMALSIKSKALLMPVTRGWFLGIPLPKALLPISETREFQEDSTFQFDVTLSLPVFGLIVRYQGSLNLDK